MAKPKQFSNNCDRIILKELSAHLSDIEVVIGICTFQRPQGLRAALDSLNKTILDANFSVKIIVCDNDPLLSAQKIILDLATRMSCPLIYLNESQPGIALARNKIVHKFLETGAMYLSFIDDDETVDQTWLQKIIDFALKHDASLVKGSVVSIFAKEANPAYQNVDLFHRATPSSGSFLSNTGTGNLLIKRDVFLKIGFFDSRLLTLGGEDIDFTSRAVYGNYKIIFCKEAIVYEHVPSDRCTFRWIVLRYLRGSTLKYNFLYRFGGNLWLLKFLGWYFYKISKGLTYSLLGACFYVFKFGKCFWATGIGNLLSTLGVFFSFFNLYFTEYGRDEKGKISFKLLKIKGLR